MLNMLYYSCGGSFLETDRKITAIFCFVDLYDLQIHEE